MNARIPLPQAGGGRGRAGRLLPLVVVEVVNKKALIGHMPLSHILLLVLVVVLWGFNFVPSRIGLDYVPPFTFTALRAVLTVFPVIFFIKRPALPLHRLAAYGVLVFGGQFACLYLAIHNGLSAGLAALVLQTQVFFTIGLALLVLRERPMPFQILGALVAAGGIVLVGAHTGGDVTMPGLLLAMIAAFCWSCGNLLARSFGKADMFAVIVWGNVFTALIMLALAAVSEGPAVMLRSVAAMPVIAWLSLAYIVIASSFVGYTLWNRMLARHHTAVVAPFTLMVPAIAMVSASVFLGEQYPMWKFEATVLILAGLALNQFGGKLLARCERLWKPAPQMD